MIKRTSIEFVNKKLKENPNWNILDIGCGYTANDNATVLADVLDLSKFYKDKKFILINQKKLPFKDKEFDFVIASHVVEHIKDFEFFLGEIERVTNKGYIELPSRLGDNLVYENIKDHIWWFKFDDTKNCIIASKKNQLLEPFITVSMSRNLDKVFKESLTLELAWEDKIDYVIDDNIRNNNFKKITFFNILRKHLSKKLRTLIRKKSYGDQNGWDEAGR